MHKKLLPAAFFALFSIFPVISQGTPKGKLSAVESTNLKQGADAYKNGDWTSAIFFLRKVISVPGAASDENYFMLIKSEIYAGEYRQAQNDCERFMELFSLSPYSEYVRYQNGRLLHLLARNEDSILALSDFCHQNPESELYPLAIFWIAECFYDEYNFEPARGLYERVINDFPACEKAPQAQYKLDLIERREREEKLLYLLKVIGEENLSTREEYERQLRVYALEDENGIKRSLIDAQARIAELEGLLQGADSNPPVAENVVVEEAVAEVPPVEDKSAKEEPAAAVSKPKDPVTHVIQSVNEPSFRVKQNKNGQGTSAVKSTSEASKDAELQTLKRKAKQLQYLLDGQSEEGEK